MGARVHSVNVIVGDVYVTHVHVSGENAFESAHLNVARI